MRTLVGIGILVALAVVVGVVWRLVSKRRSAPCPAWLVPLLENPYVGTLAGAALLIERADVRPAMRVLDVGAGPGRLTLPLAEHVGPTGLVVALDVQEKMLGRLRQRVAERGLENFETVLGGAGAGALGYGGFDRALLVTVLGEIVDKEKALAEIHGLLEPGGLLSVTELIPDPHYQRRKTVCRLAEAVGFRRQQRFGTWLAFTLNFRK